MSIAIVLIPLALPAVPVLIGLRLVLGKQGFQRMIDSLQVKLPTSIATHEELANIITSAGYDLKPWLGNFKTHLPGGQFFTWEFENGRWVAVFPKGICQAAVGEFLHNVQSRAGRSDFLEGVNSPLALSSEIIPTNFRDEALLTKTLEEAGLFPRRDSSGHLLCSVGTATLRFSHAVGEPYQVEIENAINRQELIQHLLNLDEDYRRCVQADTYQQLKGRIGASKLVLENEEVLEDNSIVLTVSVPESS